MWSIDKAEGFGLGVVNDEETWLVFTAFLVLNQPVSCDKDVSLSPCTGKVHFTWKVYLLLLWKKGRWGGGQSNLSAFAVSFDSCSLR